MRSYILSLITISFISVQSFAQISVSGKVTGQSKASVPGATVSLRNQDTQEGTTTASDGTCNIELAKAGV
jgi:hypothetical protein